TDDQTLSLSGAMLSIENGNAVNLSGIGTDDQTLSLSGTTLSIEGGNSVNLSTLPGDNLGNHTATQNLALNGKWLSGDGGNEGVFVDANGNVGIGNSQPTAPLHVYRSGGEDAIILIGAEGFESEARLELSKVGGFASAGIGYYPGNGFLRVRTNSNHPIVFEPNGLEAMRIANNGNVGIGTISPVNKLTVSGNADFSGNVGIGTANPVNELTVSGNADFTGNVGVGTSSPSNKLTVSGNADFTGNVGIGTASPATLLHVEGAASGSTSTDFVATIKNTDTDATNSTRYNGLKIQAGKDNNNGANSRFIAFYRPDGAEIGTVRQDGASTINYSTSSDVRLKQHIVPTAYSLDDLLKIEVQDYEFRTEPGRKQTGFIAQDLYKVYPAAVSKGGDDVVTDPWMVDYGKLTPLLVKAVQDQQATIDAQQKRIAELEAQVARIDQLESLLLQMQQNLDNEKSEASIK
ncbi:MAG: tail fiber domain-containing protein, partial [Saprospiraceae bacterium]|nr:tail fiber domain-containing protein [Saprospiraceae bacterium]